jgi:hypothetical protein
MDDRQAAVAGEMDVTLDDLDSDFDRRGEGGQGILGMLARRSEAA